MIINTGNAPDADAQRPKIASDGKTRIKLSNFNTKQGTQIRITNDERRALLNQFNPMVTHSPYYKNLTPFPEI